MKRLGATIFAAMAMALPALGVCAEKKVIDGMTVMPAVIQAVEDEIYDMSHETAFFLIDGNGGGDSSPASINIYVSKRIVDGVGVAIYKNMPYGEVYRYFVVEDNGMVSLSGRPSAFPPIGGSMLTIYMTNKDVCAFIDDAYNGTVSIDPQVSADRIKAAGERQILRRGYSVRLGKGVGQYR